MYKKGNLQKNIDFAELFSYCKGTAIYHQQYDNISTIYQQYSPKVAYYRDT